MSQMRRRPTSRREAEVLHYRHGRSRAGRNAIIAVNRLYLFGIERTGSKIFRLDRGLSCFWSLPHDRAKGRRDHAVPEVRGKSSLSIIHLALRCTGLPKATLLPSGDSTLDNANTGTGHAFSSRAVAAVRRGKFVQEHVGIGGAMLRVPEAAPPDSAPEWGLAGPVYEMRVNPFGLEDRFRPADWE